MYLRFTIYILPHRRRKANFDKNFIHLYYSASVEKHPIHKIKHGDAVYPKLLAQISDPPEVLYCRGNTDLLNTECLGIVGTRNITPYGKEATKYLAGQLAGNGYTIVSGLALGVDTIAHRTTLDAKGKTIAVFGTGPDDKTIFPKDNFNLAMDILKSGGLLISEYPPGTHGTKFTFPLRNRIISGLSKGVVIIEADQRSGALITAKSALDQNRDVFAVPGNIFSPRSVGPNLLIQDGAKLVLTASDILSEYQLSTLNFPLSTSDVSTQDPMQKKILAILNSSGPTHVDEIIKISGCETPQVMTAISILEIKGRITHIGNGTYKI